MKSKLCGHSYDKTAIEQHIKRMRQKAKCPVVGCQYILKMDDIMVDIILTRELRKRH